MNQATYRYKPLMVDDPTVSMDHFTQTIFISAEDGEITRSHQIAGVGARSLAGLADLCLQMATFTGMAWLAITGRPDLFPRESWPWALPLAFVEWHIIYLMLFESFTGGISPGKAMIGLRVIALHGRKPSARALLIRNVSRVFEIGMGCYLGAYFCIGSTSNHQRLGDLYADTTVIYNTPLAVQLYLAEVPESLYSTSEDGYLLQGWVEREKRFDAESQTASAIDLAAYLHSKYDTVKGDLRDPITYLHQLHEAEHQHHQGKTVVADDEIASTAIGGE